MIRTQVQLDEEQHERLRALAAERSQSIAQLVREGVDRVLGDADRSRRWDAHELGEAGQGADQGPSGPTPLSGTPNAGRPST